MAFRASRTRRRAVRLSVRQRRGSGGFSLVEVLVAISIFSISALGIQALFLAADLGIQLGIPYGNGRLVGKAL